MCYRNQSCLLKHNGLNAHWKTALFLTWSSIKQLRSGSKTVFQCDSLSSIYVYMPLLSSGPMTSSSKEISTQTGHPAGQITSCVSPPVMHH